MLRVYMMENKYGFIYITTNLINNKKYIGQKKLDNGSRWKSYLGSGVHLQKAIKKYGKENFKREIIDYANSLEELNVLERYYIEKYNAVESKEFYNVIEGGTASEELSNINSIPVVNIDTGYIFKSIKDASIWAGYSEVFIIKSLDYKHNIKNKIPELIFKKLSTVKPNHKLCSCCASNMPDKINSKLCDDCLNNEYLNIEDYNVMVLSPNNVTHTIKRNWVKEFISRYEEVEEKYYPLRKPFERKKSKRKWIKLDDTYYFM